MAGRQLRQIYLLDNPLLREPLTLEHIKPRLPGHWGTTPGINFVYAHLNRISVSRERNVLAIIGPGHGGPALVANTYLEGSFSDMYPDIGMDVDGMRRLFRQFSFPGGIPSHCAPDVPGSINEGGELGYSLSHAFGAAFDNPARDGVVLPILHLNGYKIANPTLLARIPRDELRSLLIGYGWEPFFVEGHEPEAMHQQMAGTLDRVMDRIDTIQREARRTGAKAARPSWPMIVLQSPKGWTGPKIVDGQKVEGTWRAHQVPRAGLATNPEHLHMLEQWLRSYQPEELFDEKGAPVELVREASPKGTRRMGSTPHANGGLLLQDLHLPEFSPLGPRRNRVQPTRWRVRSDPTHVAGDFRVRRQSPRHGRPGHGSVVGVTSR